MANILGQLNLPAAEVVHHWRFEPSPDFLRDSVGQAHLEMAGAPIESATLPSDGRGVAFPTSFTNIGGNNGSADFTAARGGLQGQGAALDVEDFTVEVFTNVSHFAASANTVQFLSQGAPQAVANDFFWTLHVRKDQSFNTVVNELAITFSYGTYWDSAPSGILIDEATDYFLAASYEIDSSVVSYHVQDLASGLLRVAHAPYRSAGLRASDYFTVGDVPFPSHAPGGSNYLTDGLIDEVRISRGLLDYSEMLASNAAYTDAGYGTVSTITLGPRAIYHASATDTFDLISKTSASVSANDKNVAKFELPAFISVDQLESATLRLFVSAVSGTEGSALGLRHSVEDNLFERLTSVFDDPRYLDAQRSVFTFGSPSNQYMDIDVTELVRADYAQDGPNPIAAFRLDSTGDGEYRLSMPRNVSRQPLLVLSLRRSIPGDFDGNGVLDSGDLDLLRGAVGATVKFDLNSDGTIDFADREFWVRNLKQTWFGDVNLDGEFSSADFVSVFEQGKFETNQPAGWSQGGWDGDGMFSSGDLVVAFQDGGYEQGPRVAAGAVPEPSRSAVAMLTGCFIVILVYRSRPLQAGRPVSRAAIPSLQ